MSNNPDHDPLRATRRGFLRGAGAFAGAVALGPEGPGRWLSAGGERPPMVPRAKRLIHLCMAGGMSHLESFDYKPKLAAMHGKPMPKSFTDGQPIAQLQGQKLSCLGPQFKFHKRGDSGQEISEAFPFLGRIADDICIVRSVKTEQINHDPAHTFMNTGTSVSGRPSMGSWLLHALGSETSDLPGYVVLTSVGKGGQSQPIASRQWHSGFLPSNLQGVHFQSTGAAVHYVSPPPGVDLAGQREVLKAIEAINRTGGRVLAVDLPSGLDCDTGQPLGRCVRASHTATMVGSKLGMMVAEASEWIGEVHVVDIGIPRTLCEELLR